MRRTRWTALITIVVSLIAVSAMIYFETMEQYYDWSQAHEDWELDELVSVFVVAACALLFWFGRLWRLAAREVTARTVVEAQLRTSRHTMAQVFASSPVPMFISARESSEVLAVNAEFERLLGYQRSSTLGHTEHEMGFWTSPHMAGEIRNRLQRQQGRVENVEVALRTASGEDRVALCSAVAVTLENTAVIVGALNDITERKRLEGELTHQAFHDALTGLPNRSLFEDRVRHALERTSRSGITPAILFLDLDDFKQVNDTMGHAAGDQLLREVTRRLGAILRASDTCARFGGDEFAVLLEDATSLNEATTIASRIGESLRVPFVTDGKDLFVDVSIGIAMSRPAASAVELMREADLAMYASKSAGKGRVTAFEVSMQAEVMRRLTLGADLRGAVRRGEIHVLFQPIVHIASGQLVSIEALARWQHPVYGVVVPSEFIPIAEESGTIVELGQWVLRTACGACANLRAAQGLPSVLTVSVNLSARQLAASTLLADVATALADSGLPASGLMLEITESVLVREYAMAEERLRALRALGVRLAIDDFGTGYSSLSYLQRFPVDVLKIDKSFTDRLGSGDAEGDVASAVITLGGMVHLQTVAEGIETLAQRDRLVELGCELGQGFLFSKPVEFGMLQTFVDGAGLRPAMEPGR